jgi:hypothetical protein
MATARQSGHTTAAYTVAKEYFNNAIFLSPTYDISSRLNDNFVRFLIKNNIQIVSYTKRHISTKDKKYHFGSYNSLEFSKGLNCEAVFIDPACMLRPREIDDIYRTFAPCMYNNSEKFFIFIG